MVEVDFSNRQQDILIDQDTMDFLTKVIETTLELEDLRQDSYVSVSLVGEEEIQALNRDYRNVDAITDVLSFPLDESLIDLLILGDIVINTKRVMEQAKEFNHSYKRELGYLCAHSTLHLLGYDHEVEIEKKIMREKEEKVMNYLDLTR